jgi:tripartite-type tricarboxylate transporter receptor subunit TctC
VKVYALASLLILAPLGARAEEAFPSRPIRLVTVCPRGSISDVNARPLAAAMAKVLRNPVEVTNVSCPKVGVRPSAMFLVANADADGYTLLVAVPSLHSMTEAERFFGRTPPYTVDQLAPIARISAPPAIFAVRADHSWKTLREFVADAKRRPGEISFASGGAFKPPHMATEMFAKAAAITLRHVDDERHSPVAAILEGRVDAGSVGPGALPHIRAGKLRPLAASGATRIAALQDLPTFGELGYAVEFYLWAGLFAPARTPAPVLKKLRDAVRPAVEDLDFKASMAKIETPVAYLDALDFQRFLEQQATRLHDTVKRAVMATGSGERSGK